MKPFLRPTAFAGFMLAGWLCAGAAARPNIVLILADDLGAHDLACYGADLHETPHLDRLAREGVRFTQAYAASTVCSPTRASLLTGKHPARLHITIWAEGSLAGPQNRALLQGASLHDLPHTETTIAKHLQSAGYLTALVGKWHLGGAGHFPEVHGFDVNIGGTHWGAPNTFFWPYRGGFGAGGEFRYVPHLEFGQPGEYLTDRLTDEALRVIDRAAADRKPFFLYLAHHAPHTPIEAKPADVAYFEKKLRPGLNHRNATYAAMVKSLDESVGRVLARLAERRLERDTLVVFASDNGGYLGTDRRQSVPVTTNAPLRSGKGSLYEGGLRVPLIVKWPGVTPAGQASAEPVVLTDLFRTFAGAAQLADLARAPGDGLDLAPALHDPAARLGRDTFFFHYPHYYHAPPSTPASAVREGDWKLVEYFEGGRLELFNLRDDPGEARDLARQEPAKAAHMRSKLAAWRESVGASLPTPNPNFRPAKK
ncbi:MAG: sulfatase [Verrucomicrobia bacterium]|nr:sulfatase [Verrucomicrobiota bacterium]